ncbi:MAG: hypothetical protein KDA84_00290 [Planctomycetaceae bacterium]|nr:hypothetical protein [Planctomycetaceae bacterium]
MLNQWWDIFEDQIGRPEFGARLKDASAQERLRDWTRLTTTAVVRTCELMGWEATARGHQLRRLPESASEYLSLDVMAFPDRENCGDVPWPMPVAVFELENSPRDDRVAYSLWKVLCVRTALRMVYAYRRDWEQTRGLMNHLASEVIGSLSLHERKQLEGVTTAVTGSRGESETFPHGYFKLWLLDTNLGKFERV